MKIRPVILCGGSGTRLWSNLKQHQAKQFIDFGGWTLLGKTLERIKGSLFDTPIISTNLKYLKEIKKHLKRHKIKVPAVQAMNAMHGFNNYLSNNLEEPYGSGNLMASFAYCAVFPDIQLGKDDWAPNSPRSLMVGKEDFPNFEQRVYEILEGQTYKKPGVVLCRLIRTALMPSISIKRKRYSKGSVEIIEEQISRLTEAQFNGWAQLRANKRMIIRGIAGSGKTVIAEEIAKELSTEGLSVLLLCYNKRLREWIQEDLKGTDITVRTYHSLCKELCSKAGLDQPEFDEDYWDSGFQQFFEDAVEVAGVTYDAIIIDEGQDFHENWFENLELEL